MHVSCSPIAWHQRIIAADLSLQTKNRSIQECWQLKTGVVIFCDREKREREAPVDMCRKKGDFVGQSVSVIIERKGVRVFGKVARI